VPIDGFIGPAHVSTVIGSRPYEHFAEEYRKPVVIAGFEPLDVMQAILMLVRQVNEGRAEVENEFTRAVTPRRQPEGAGLVSEVFELRRSFEWRGLGEVPYSALRIRPKPTPPSTPSGASAWTTSRCPTTRPASAAPSCAASSGRTDCKIFGTVCTPENPMGSCMVSSKAPAPRITVMDVTRTCIEMAEVKRRLRAPARPQARPRRHDATARAGGPWCS
jgi:hydrogenase expression/formation protein HypD